MHSTLGHIHLVHLVHVYVHSYILHVGFIMEKLFLTAHDPGIGIGILCGCGVEWLFICPGDAHHHRCFVQSDLSHTGAGHSMASLSARASGHWMF